MLYKSWLVLSRLCAGNHGERRLGAIHILIDVGMEIERFFLLYTKCLQSIHDKIAASMHNYYHVVVLDGKQSDFFFVYLKTLTQDQWCHQRKMLFLDLQLIFINSVFKVCLPSSGAVACINGVPYWRKGIVWGVLRSRGWGVSGRG